MRDDLDGLKRRTFLKSGLLAAAGTTVLGQRLALAAAPDEKTIDSPGDMPVRPFGRTGHKLPILGMGGSAFVRMFIRAYGVPLPTTEERVAMVRHAYDQGLRYFDTARVYGESESIFGEGLKGVRDQVYLATKVHTTNPDQVRPSIETSLAQLQTDYVDCAQIHSPAIERVGFEGAMKIHAELAKLRDEGMVRFIGLTTHVAFETVYQMLATGEFDQVLLAYGYFRKGMDTILSNTNIEHRELCLAKAHELGTAIVAMKVMGANILGHNAGNLVPDYDEAARARLPAAAIRWVVADERVSMLNIGVSKPSDIDENLATLRGPLELTHDDRRLLADFCQRAYESEMVREMNVT